MVEKFGVRRAFVVESVWQEEQLLLVGIVNGVVGAQKFHFVFGGFLIDRKRYERFFDYRLVEAVFFESVEDFKHVGRLAGIYDAQSVDIPVYFVARFADPPV